MLRKIEPHQKCSSISPDQVIDTATPAPATAAQTAMAAGRRSGGNTLARPAAGWQRRPAPR